MGKKLTPKIILEGTRLTNKTDLAFKLNQHPRIVGARKYLYPSPLISAEWCAFTNFPWGRGLINFEPHEEQHAMETYNLWISLFEHLPYYSWIVDRFHISTWIYQSHQGRFYDFRWMEERLKKLNFCIVLLTRDQESFHTAREERLKVSGNPSQYDDLGIFIREQEEYRLIVRRSLLPYLELNLTHNDLDSACERIADWMEPNQLLWMNE